MLHQSDDRRAKRSRRLLKQGLFELLGEKKFSDISVRDITDRMDLNRGTFYLHYTGTYDLLQNMETDVLQDVQAMIDQHRPEAEEGTLQPIFQPILRYIVENRKLCETLFLNSANSEFIGRVHQLIYENGSGLIRRRWPDAPPERMEDLLSFVTYGLVGLLKRWFDTNMALSEEEVVRLADRLVNGAAAAAQSLQVTAAQPGKPEGGS